MTFYSVTSFLLIMPLKIITNSIKIRMNGTSHFVRLSKIRYSHHFISFDSEKKSSIIRLLSSVLMAARKNIIKYLA